jgi:hypothetical protein
MCKSFTKTMVLIALITLVAGCGKSEPTVTAMPPTHTPVLAENTRPFEDQLPRKDNAFGLFNFTSGFLSG